MRLAAQAKLGFYAAAPEAVAEILKHLYCRGPNPERKLDAINIIDPCAGKGLALKQLREGLNVPPSHTYAVELDKARAAEIAENIPGVNLIGPASFLNCQITGYSFGLAYVNPPFDHELGGGKREEMAFAQAATRLLVPKGILVLVLPIRALVGNGSFVDFLDSNYEDIAVYKFPDGVTSEGEPIRPYNEIVVFGKKRSTAIPMDVVREKGTLNQLNYRWSGYVEIVSLPALGQVQPKYWNNGRPSFDREEDIRTWEIPLSWKPNVFKKTMFTDDELLEAINASPLNSHLKEVVVPPPASPPLPLGNGHLGLILASGMLDGVVEGPHGVHVVRGSSHKVEYHNKELSESTENPETGAVTTKDVFSQRMVTVIRVVESDGNIITFSNEAKEKDEDDPGED